MGALGGAVGGLAGLGLGSVLGGVGGGMAGRLATGFVEGGLSDVASRMAMNAVMGCAWNDGLWSAFIGGGLGGGVGAAMGGAIDSVRRGFLSKSHAAGVQYFPQNNTRSAHRNVFNQELVITSNILAEVDAAGVGHGAWLIDEPEIVVPYNWSVAFYGPLGESISDEFGRDIEEDLVPPLEFYGPGQIIPEHVLFPNIAIPKLKFSENPSGVILEVVANRAVTLSETFKLYPEGINLRWAACRVACTQEDVEKFFRTW